MKSQNSANEPKLGQDKESIRRGMKAPVQAQVQMQIKEENQTRDQTLTKQKEGLQMPLTKQTTVKDTQNKSQRMIKYINTLANPQ